MRGPLGPHFEQNWVPMALGSSATVACAHLVFYHLNPLVCQFHNHNGSCSASSSAEGTLLRTQRVGQFFQYNHRFGFQRPIKLKVGKGGWWDQPLLTSVTAVIAGATASKFKLLLTHAASSHLLVRFCLRSHCKWRQSLLIIDDKLAVETQAPSWALHMTLLQSRVFGSTIWWLKAASLRVIHVPRVHGNNIFFQIAPLSCTWTKLMECMRYFQYNCYRHVFWGGCI